MDTNFVKLMSLFAVMTLSTVGYSRYPFAPGIGVQPGLGAGAPGAGVVAGAGVGLPGTPATRHGYPVGGYPGVGLPGTPATRHGYPAGYYWDATHQRYVNSAGQYVYQSPRYYVVQNPDGSVSTITRSNAAGGSTTVQATGNGAYVTHQTP